MKNRVKRNVIFAGLWINVDFFRVDRLKSVFTKYVPSQLVLKVNNSSRQKELSSERLSRAVGGKGLYIFYVYWRLVSVNLPIVLSFLRVSSYIFVIIFHQRSTLNRRNPYCPLYI